MGSLHRGMQIKKKMPEEQYSKDIPLQSVVRPPMNGSCDDMNWLCDDVMHNKNVSTDVLLPYFSIHHIDVIL